ncbi:MAG: AAA family ATPase [Caldimicrobium sp.]
MKKLPIGIQSFEEIRDKKENYVYVDKTRFAYELIVSGKYYFLSRPRRFGKSLFLSTLNAIFEGKKDLFKGLYIYDKWNWREKYPVIYLDFSEGVLNSEVLIIKYIHILLEVNQRKLEVECKEKEVPFICFKELILKTYEKYKKKVVILVDEYDKPILDNIDNPQVAIFAKEELKKLYSVIKGADEYLKFVFLTGVSKFSKTSLFSGLNNLKDITLDPKYGNICGYTQQELERYFGEHLKDVDLEKVRAWYNGYNFLGDPLYNPFDILLFLDHPHKAFKSYWFETGTPSFLLKIIEKNNYFLPSLSNLVTEETLLDTFEIDNIKPEVLLFQTGYLTIDKVETTPYETLIYKLKFPNKEVKIAFNTHLIHYLFDDSQASVRRNELYKALSNADFSLLQTFITSLFASIPYTHYVKTNLERNEGFYATVLYVYMQSLGFEVIGEDVTNRGRVDLTVKLPEVIYIMEIKVGEGDPLEQIKARKYYEKYLSEGKAIYLLGLRFDPMVKNLIEFKWERV